MGESIEAILVDEDDFDVDVSIEAERHMKLVSRRKRAGRILQGISIVDMIVLVGLALFFFSAAYETNNELDDYEPGDGWLDQLFHPLIVAIYLIIILMMITFGLYSIVFAVWFMVFAFIGDSIRKGKPYRFLRNILIGNLVMVIFLIIVAGILAYISIDDNEFHLSTLLIFTSVFFTISLPVVAYVLYEMKAAKATFKPDPPKIGAGAFLRKLNIEPKWTNGRNYLQSDIEEIASAFRRSTVELGKKMVPFGRTKVVFLFISLLLSIPVFPILITDLTGEQFIANDLFRIGNWNIINYLVLIFLVSSVLCYLTSKGLIRYGKKLRNHLQKIPSKKYRLYFVLSSISFILGVMIPFFGLAFIEPVPGLFLLIIVYSIFTFFLIRTTRAFNVVDISYTILKGEDYFN